MLRYTSLKFAVCAHKLTPQTPTQKNSQSHSNNSSASVAKHLSEFDHLVGLALKGLNNAFVSTLDKRCTQHYLCLQHASLCIFQQMFWCHELHTFWRSLGSFSNHLRWGAIPWRSSSIKVIWEYITNLKEKTQQLKLHFNSWNHTSVRAPPVNLLHIFRMPFQKNTSGGLHLSVSPLIHHESWVFNICS